MDYFISVLIGYFLGSIPFAYLVLKKFKNVDITKSGSGNVGALNSLKVSKSKRIGVLVLLLDFTKGALTVVLIRTLLSPDYLLLILGAITAVFSHCYTPWLKFKGGRGLATAAGSLLFVIPFVAIVWMILWLLVFLIKKNVHWGNIMATILTPIVVFVIPEMIKSINFVNQEPNSKLFAITILVLMFIIMSKHIKPLKELIKKETN